MNTLKKIILYTIGICVLFCSCMIAKKDNYSNLELDFYYNATVVYPDTGRSINDILNGYYDIKKHFTYSEISDYNSLDKIFKQKPKIIYDEKLQRIYESNIDCLCVFTLNGKEILNFTYSASDDKYCLSNGKLINRNKVYDGLAQYLIQKL